MSEKYGGAIPIGPDDLRDTPRAVRDFKVETMPWNEWRHVDMVYVKATALVATDDAGTIFVRRKIGYVTRRGTAVDIHALKDTMARCKHEHMRDKE